MDLTEFQTAAEIASELHVTAQSVVAWANKGMFPEPDLHLGAKRLWRRASVEEWIQSGGSRPRPKS